MKTDTYPIGVQCLKLLQSSHLDKSARVVMLEVWDGSKYIESARFEATMGSWMQRPALKNGFWRIRNRSPIPAKWQLAELHFFKDVICQIPAPGAIVGSLWVRVEGDVHKYNIKNVADGDPETIWIPDCVPAEGDWTGCQMAPGDNTFAAPAWIGYDYGLDPETVRCVQLLQSDAYVAGGDRQTHADIIDIQKWEGDKFEVARTIYNLKAGVISKTLPGPKNLWVLNSEEDIPQGQGEKRSQIRARDS